MVERRARRAVGAAALSLALAACGGGAADSDAGPRPELPVTSTDSPLPEVTVRDVVADEWVQLADQLPASQPLLVWFWAPH